MLRAPDGGVPALPDFELGVPPRADPDVQPLRRTRWSFKTHARVVFWVVVLAVFGIASYVIDTGGHASPFPLAVKPSLAARNVGSGRMAVAVAPGDVMVRVSVNAAAGGPSAWFWCLESSLGLPWQQHLCRNSGVSDPATVARVSDGVVHLDATSQDAVFFVQMYCRDACDWQAEVLPDPR
jgi:hypothetical protein